MSFPSHVNTLSRSWMGTTDTWDAARWIMVGMPYDGTTSNRPGTRFGPSVVREASWGLETYSPNCHRELEVDTTFFDAGDLELPLGNRDGCLDVIYDATQAVLKANKRWFGIGGEHLVTYPTVKAYVEKYPDLAILHFDAHADLRDDYLGEKLSHATVIRRCVELTGPERLVQIGIRSGPKSEFDWMKTNQTLLTSEADLERGLKRLQNRPVFVTVDLDVLDPSVLPGTGTPEPGGMQFNELMRWLKHFEGLNVVGADALELSPPYDASGVSTAVAAKVIREMLLMWP